MITELLEQAENTDTGVLSKEFQQYLNKNYIIRYYPDSQDTHTNQLVGVKRMMELIGDKEVFESVMKRLDDCIEDKLDVRLRRGIRFTFVTK